MTVGCQLMTDHTSGRGRAQGEGVGGGSDRVIKCVRVHVRVGKAAGQREGVWNERRCVGGGAVRVLCDFIKERSKLLRAGCGGVVARKCFEDRDKMG
mmetsp:Transcript_13787/g.22872  ORF Transcript_13787/g.22872 Transcript_13787/m.22872 type:complete len:97 (+) Transcript_13787:101-391(+)